MTDLFTQATTQIPHTFPNLFDWVFVATSSCGLCGVTVVFALVSRATVGMDGNHGCLAFGLPPSSPTPHTKNIHIKGIGEVTIGRPMDHKLLHGEVPSLRRHNLFQNVLNSRTFFFPRHNRSVLPTVLYYSITKLVFICGIMIGRKRDLEMSSVNEDRPGCLDLATHRCAGCALHSRPRLVTHVLPPAHCPPHRAESMTFSHSALLSNKYMVCLTPFTPIFRSTHAYLHN